MFDYYCVFMFSSSINDTYLTFTKLLIDPFNLGNVKRSYVIIRLTDITNKILKTFFH